MNFVQLKDSNDETVWVNLDFVSMIARTDSYNYTIVYFSDGTNIEVYEHPGKILSHSRTEMH